MQFPVIYQQQDDGILISFPDLPEALSSAEHMRDAHEMAYDALISALEFYFEDYKRIPSPTSSTTGNYVELPPALTAKVMLLNTLAESQVSYAELARRLGKKPQEVQRMIDLRHATKIDTVAAALETLGYQLQLSLTPRKASLNPS
ncbi:type II toxin-antitoxin system HicB family antitoxin [Pseudidiomarina mangrovi]|uniref:type II toxin-antitoxin system HicB family antitoxin n=1 Tax=Pseudidiomarina mangrovi TaxID=2487133 RepID=UPI000FCB0A89|nr:type II toxin-antitoxin system HicB family antitoxin [Pseudidiomarina mangrovi]CAI8154125.1 MAG: Antitoxin HicB [Pseudidiomarina mangrovi]